MTMPDLVSPVSVCGVDQNMTINLLSELFLEEMHESSDNYSKCILINVFGILCRIMQTRCRPTVGNQRVVTARWTWRLWISTHSLSSSPYHGGLAQCWKATAYLFHTGLSSILIFLIFVPFSDCANLCWPIPYPPPNSVHMSWVHLWQELPFIRYVIQEKWLNPTPLDTITSQIPYPRPL